MRIKMHIQIRREDRVSPVCGYCGKEHPGRCAESFARLSRPTMVAAPHARAKDACPRCGHMHECGSCGETRTARDDEPTSVGFERRRCRRCSAPIEPDAVEGERFPGEAAAWLSGFCGSRCSENDAREAITNGMAWWLMGRES